MDYHDKAHILKHLSPILKFNDITDELVCLGIFGPKSRDLISRISKDDFANETFKFGNGKFVNIGSKKVWVQRLSYVGELGFEIYIENKDAKEVAASVSRHLERTATMKFLQNTLNHWVDNFDACRSSYMISAHRAGVYADTPLLRSTQAVLPCGHIFDGDMLLLTDGTVGMVIDFWHWGDEGVEDISVRVDLFVPHAGRPLRFDKRGDAMSVFTCSDVVEPVAWYPHSTPNSIVVALPLVA